MKKKTAYQNFRRSKPCYNILSQIALATFTVFTFIFLAATFCFLFIMQLYPWNNHNPCSPKRTVENLGILLLFFSKREKNMIFIFKFGFYLDIYFLNSDLVIISFLFYFLGKFLFSN